ncbi:hypothetical protein JCM15519_17540 [Fundidesulfovibrio butyratiphilus]
MTTPPRVLFRTEAGHTLGLGHLSRARSLAAAFCETRPCAVTFAVGDQALARSFLGPETVIARPEDAARETYDIVVVDIPGLAPARQARLARMGRLAVGIDDDGPGPFVFDILVRPTPLGVAPAETRGQVWLGGDCVILHPRFEKVAKRPRMFRQVPERVLVCFGGGDPADYTAKVLPILRALPGLKVLDVILGAAYQPVEKSLLAALLRKSQPLTYAKYASGLTFSRALPASFLNRLQESTFSTGCYAARDKGVGAAESDPRIAFRRNIEDMASALHQADMALISGGTLLYETCALGTPAVVLPQNHEQAEEAAFFASHGAVLTLGPAWDETRAQRAIVGLSEDAGLRRALAAAGPGLVAPDGARRIAGKLLEIVAQRASESTRPSVRPSA